MGRRQKGNAAEVQHHAADDAEHTPLTADDAMGYDGGDGPGHDAEWSNDDANGPTEQRHAHATRSHVYREWSDGNSTAVLIRWSKGMTTRCAINHTGTHPNYIHTPVNCPPIKELPLVNRRSHIGLALVPFVSCLASDTIAIKERNRAL